MVLSNQWFCLDIVCVQKNVMTNIKTKKLFEILQFENSKNMKRYSNGMRSIQLFDYYPMKNRQKCIDHIPEFKGPEFQSSECCLKCRFNLQQYFAFPSIFCSVSFFFRSLKSISRTLKFRNYALHDRICINFRLFPYFLCMSLTCHN